jgi:hypothetical protein
MSMKHLFSRAGAAVVVAAVVTAVPTPARADGTFFNWCAQAEISCQTGTVVSEGDVPPGHVVIETVHHTGVAIKYYGDFVYVADGNPDGYSAVVEISSPNSVGDLYSRWCRNASGSGTWVRCQFNWNESTTKNVYAGVRYDNATASTRNMNMPFQGA